MGCEVLVEGATAGELEHVQALFEERDAAFSRFRPDSELTGSSGRRRRRLVSPLFARMVETALGRVSRPAASSTRRSAPRWRRAGYDRDFAEPGAERRAGRAGAGRLGRALRPSARPAVVGST